MRLAVDSPKLDPSVLAPFLIAATSRIGIVTTLSTYEYNPFLMARLTNSLDHVSEGRAGWNLVTGSNDGGAQNFGLDKQFPHDERYDMADEYVEAVIQLWESWDKPTPWSSTSRTRSLPIRRKFIRCISRANIFARAARSRHRNRRRGGR